MVNLRKTFDNEQNSGHYRTPTIYISNPVNFHEKYFYFFDADKGLRSSRIVFNSFANRVHEEILVLSKYIPYCLYFFDV